MTTNANNGNAANQPSVNDDGAGNAARDAGAGNAARDAGDAARRYHESTKLSYISLRTKPALYKTYAGRPELALPANPPLPEAATLAAVAGMPPTPPEAGQPAPLGLEAAAALLHYSAGLIRRSRLRSAGEVHYRAAASAGALYPIELYLVCGELPGLPAGVYHFAPARNALTRLRSGDCRAWLAAAGGVPAAAEAPLSIVCSSVFWRSAWKYRARGYRYCWWDNGTILANLLAATHALGQPAQLSVGFADAEIDALLGLDSPGEATTCVVSIGYAGDANEHPGGSVPESAAPTAAHPAAAPGNAAALPVLDAIPPGDAGDEHRQEYAESSALHRDSGLATADEVRQWLTAANGPTPPAPSVGPSFRPADSGASRGSGVSPGSGDWPDSAALGPVIAQRGSTRRFARQLIPAAQLSALLQAAAAPIPSDYGGGLTDIYLIVNAVDGLASGAYYYDRAAGRLALLQAGDFREEAGHLCFEQALGADAAAVAFFMTDLEAALARLGSRGYRAAQLEAGITGGRMYLGSHAMGWGATGMTFYDDAVSAFLSPHAAGKSLMFLVGLGVTDAVNRVRPFRSRIGVLKDSLARGAGGSSGPVPDWIYS